MDPSPALKAWQGSLRSFCPHQPHTPVFLQALAKSRSSPCILVPRSQQQHQRHLLLSHTEATGSSTDQMVHMVLIPHTARQCFPPHEIPQCPVFSTNPIYVTSKAPSHEVPTTPVLQCKPGGKGTPAWQMTALQHPLACRRATSL